MGGKKEKLSPDDGLVIQQFPELNQRFYDGFVIDYYDIKLSNLLYLVSNAEKYLDNLCESELHVGVSKLNFDREDMKSEEVKKYAKLELATTYYHCLETFIRMFLAHATLSDCPWLDISRLSIKQYKRKLECLSRDDFSGLNDILNDNNTILFVLSGYSEQPDEISVEDLLGLSHWISWCASELLQTYDYNSFKHGLAISPKPAGFKIQGYNEIKLEAHGDALEFLSRYEKGNRYVWVRETVWVPYDSRAAVIYTVSKMMQNVIKVGRSIHLKEPFNSGWLPSKGWSPKFLHSRDDDQPIKVTSMKFELAYYKGKDSV